MFRIAINFSVEILDWIIEDPFLCHYLDNQMEGKVLRLEKMVIIPRSEFS